MKLQLKKNKYLRSKKQIKENNVIISFLTIGNKFLFFISLFFIASCAMSFTIENHSVYSYILIKFY